MHTINYTVALKEYSVSLHGTFEIEIEEQYVNEFPGYLVEEPEEGRPEPSLTDINFEEEKPSKETQVV